MSDRLRRSAATLRRQAGKLREQAAELDDAARLIEGDLAAEVAGENEGRRLLRGEAIVEELRRQTIVEEVIHYTDMLARLEAAGFTVRGEKPAETILASVYRAAREGRYFAAYGRGRSGLYIRVR